MAARFHLDEWQRRYTAARQRAEGATFSGSQRRQHEEEFQQLARYVKSAGFHTKGVEAQLAAERLYLHDDPARVAASATHLLKSLTEPNPSRKTLGELHIARAEAHVALGGDALTTARQAAAEAITLAELNLGKISHPARRATTREEWIRAYEVGALAAAGQGDVADAIQITEKARARAPTEHNISVALRDIQRALAPGEWAIDYFFVGSKTLLVTGINDRDPPIQSPIPLTTSLVALFDYFAYRDGSESHAWRPEIRARLDACAAAETRDALVPPNLMGAILASQPKKLYVLCHRQLHAFPLGLLGWGDEDAALGLSLPIALIPSLRTLTLPWPGPISRDLLIVAVEHFEGASDRPGMADALFEFGADQGPSATIISDRDPGAASTKQRLSKLVGTANGRFGAVLFGTHGYSVEDHVPNETHIDMGGPDRLSAGEISTWDLRADLAITFACNSGQRSVGGRGLRAWPGDEVFGMQAAFRDAGVRQMIGGRWSLEGGYSDIVQLVGPLHTEWRRHGCAATALLAGLKSLVKGKSRRALRARRWASYGAFEFRSKRKNHD